VVEFKFAIAPAEYVLPEKLVPDVDTVFEEEVIDAIFVDVVPPENPIIGAVPNVETTFIEPYTNYITPDVS
jgi:hypothetical protein